MISANRSTKSTGIGNVSWDRYFINIALTVLQKSKDRSTKIGAVIVDEHHNLMNTGFNGFPRGIDDTNPNYHERPLKYDYTEHAERNAIYQAAAGRGGTRGATLYLGHNPVNAICTGCARAIIQSQIVRVVGPTEILFAGKGTQWENDCRTATHMLGEAGILVEAIS